MMMLTYHFGFFTPICIVSYLFFAFLWGKTILRRSKVQQWLHLIGWLASLLTMMIYAELFPTYEDDPLIMAIAALVAGFCALAVRLLFAKPVE